MDFKSSGSSSQPARPGAYQGGLLGWGYRSKPGKSSGQVYVERLRGLEQVLKVSTRLYEKSPGSSWRLVTWGPRIQGPRPPALSSLHGGQVYKKSSTTLCKNTQGKVSKTSKWQVYIYETPGLQRWIRSLFQACYCTPNSSVSPLMEGPGCSTV